MDDPVGQIIGDHRAFETKQQHRLLARGIGIGPYSLSHLAVRVPEWGQYVNVRILFEPHALPQRVQEMGLEHLGVVIGDTFDESANAHKHVLTGQQFQRPDSTPGHGMKASTMSKAGRTRGSRPQPDPVPCCAERSAGAAADDPPVED